MSSNGLLIIRPGVMILGRDASDAANVVTGTVFDDHAFVSRNQYRIRTGSGEPWLVKRLQDESPEGALGDEAGLRRRAAGA